MELAGRVLGEFVVREKIGAGGFGDVYRAEQPVLDREAVVKVARAVDGEESVRRFLREAQLASRLDHPFAAHIYAFGAEADGLLWIAMELVRGTTLDRLLASQGPLSVDRFVPLFERLCEVVHDAHQQGIVHRDIKPQNVMVMNRSGRLLPKLLDLGIAKLGDGGEADPTRSVLGSPHYMPPEQWRDPRSVDRRTDVYALGVLAFEALSGRRPYEGASLEAIASAHVSAPVPSLGASFPAALDAILARAMAKAPAERPDTALALAEGVRAAAGLASAAEDLPELDPALRESWTAHAPQPLAEAVAALEAARNPHQAWEAAGALVATAIRWLGTLALACRSRAALSAEEGALDQLRQLRRRGLDDAGWIALARELVRPFAGAPEALPVPGLIAVLIDADRGLFDDALALTRPAPPGEDQLLAQLAPALGALERLLRALALVLDHPLAVIRGPRAERWIGLRRRRRVSLPLAGRVGADDGIAVLLDRDGAAVLALAPLVQIAPPAPGADDECFLFDGPGPLGARLIAWPYGFERQDESLWSWFAASLVGAGDEERPASLAVRAPWPGLAAFTAADAECFCGREREVEAFANRLRAQPLLAVVGPSGAGKSSFLQAGVLPSLASWSAITLRPGPAPMAALAARLRRSGVIESDAVAGAAVGDALRAAADRTGPIILVVDQFEELFTLCRDPAERERFAAALAGAARTADDPVRVVLTVRDDFLVRSERLAPLRDRLSHGLAVLATPAREDLRRILVEPARRAGYDFDDPELPDRMVDEVAGTDGALALLSFTAAKLWELRDRHFRQLRARAHESLGGVGGALARHAEAILAELTAAEQRTAREAFRHLVTADGTRAVLGHAELIAMLGGDKAGPVIDRLVTARLLTAAEGETGEDRIEIVHEALLAAWPRLVEWRHEDAEGARFRDQIRSAAEQWSARDRPRGLLWRDDALTEYRLWRARFPGALPSVAEEFARASLGAAARGRRTRTVAVAILVAALAAGVLVLYRAGSREETQRRRAEDRLVQFYEEQGRQALLAGNPLHGLVYLTEAYRRGADSAALRVMLAEAARPLEAELVRLPGHTGRVWSAEYDSRGQRIVTAADDGVVRLFRADGTPERAISGHRGPVMSARFAAGDRLVVTAGKDGTARLFDAASGTERAAVEVGGLVFDVALSPDGRTLATASNGEDNLRLWDAASGALRCAAKGHDGWVNAVAFAPGAARLASAGSDGTIRIWDPADCRELALVRHGSHVQYVEFDPAGGALVAASWDGTASISDVATGTRRALLVGHSDKIEHASFSPDGTRVVTASRDGTARIWESAKGRLLSVLVGHTGSLNQAWFDGAGARVLTASSDGTARIWDARSGRLLAGLHGHGGVLLSATFAPDGRRVLTSSWDGTARVWQADESAGFARSLASADGTRFALDPVHDRMALIRDGALEVRAAADGALITTLRAAPAPIAKVAFSSDGARLLAASREHGARVFDLASGSSVAELDRLPNADLTGAGTALADHGARLRRGAWLSGPVSALAVRADGGQIAVGGRDGRIALWDPAGSRPLATAAGHDGSVDAIVYAGDQLVSVGREDHTARIWRLVGLEPVAQLKGHTGRITAFALRTGGAGLVTASEDGTARVWDLESGRLLGALEGHADFLLAVAVSGDDQLIATGSGDGTIRLWDASSYRLIGVRDARSGFVYRVAFTAGGERVVSLDASGTLLSWDVRRERRTPAELAELVACRVPLRLDVATGRLLPVSPAEASRCRH